MTYFICIFTLILCLCFGLESLAHGDCLVAQEQYSKTFREMFPVCMGDCRGKKLIYDAKFDEYFPQCARDRNKFTLAKAMRKRNGMVTDIEKKVLYDSKHVKSSITNITKTQKCLQKRRIYDKEKQKRVAHIPGTTIYSELITTGLGGNFNDTIFYDQHPECKLKNFVNLGFIQSSSNEVVRRRRRLVQRYSLCDIGSSGEYTKTANCSITTCIFVSGTLKITGVADSNGVKPTIDGGWDGVDSSDTGVSLFHVWTDDELIIENMILTNGEFVQGGAIKVGGGEWVCKFD